MAGMTARLDRLLRQTLPAFAVSMATCVATANGETMSDWQSLLERIVNINSGTQNLAGLDTVREALVPEFEKLGLEVTAHELDDGHKLLSMTVPGAAPEILLMGHIDTVFPKESPFQRFEVRGDRIYGPGVIDMKAGIVMIRDLVSRFSGTDQLGKFMVVINDDEEIGSPYSKELVKELAADIDSGLVFEPGLPDGAVVTSHSGVHWLNLAVEGRAAHAGLEPQLGINACVELSDKVVRLSKLSDYERKLSVNVGTVDGGTKRNVVCEFAEAGIDIRFVEKDDLDKTLEAIRAITVEMAVYNDTLGAAPTAKLETLVATPSMPGARTERLYALLQAAGKTVRQEVRGRHVGYTSDANFLAETGMDVLVGLGPYGGGMHTDEEFLLAPTYDERLALTEALVNEILGR
jgi:glutamate carboxypeptidase